MKKFVILLLAACLLLGCGVGYYSAVNGRKNAGEPVALYDPENLPAPESSAAPAAETPAAGEPAEETAAPASVRSIDYAALYALHPADEIVGDVDGRAVTWGDYFYWLSGMGSQIESYITTLALYGESLDWDDKLYDDSDQTLAQYVAEAAQNYLRQLCTMENVAAECGGELTAEDEAALDAQLAEDIAASEAQNEEEFFAALAESYLSPEMYRRIAGFEKLYNNSFEALYGKNGEKVAASDAIAYLSDNDYLCAAHILFMTVNESFEPLDEVTVAEKLAAAEAVSAELRAIGDPEARLLRFAQLKEQYCEDTGKAAYPDGYLFTPGTMVTEFEDGVNSLGEYEVSAPILSGFGYHVIMRLPLSAEMTVFNTEGDARALYADAQFGAMLSGRIEQSVLTLSDEVRAIDLTDYLK